MRLEEKPMLRKVKIAFAVIPISLTAITLTVMSLSHGTVSQLKAANSSYTLTLNKNNALAGLTSSYKKSVSGTVTTNLGNQVSLTVTNAKSLSNGFVQLGNLGTVYCVTSDNTKISGLTAIKVTYSNGSLKIKSSSVNTSDGSSYVTSTSNLTSGSELSLTAANSFVLEAQDASVSITEIKLTYSCSTANASYNYSQTYSVEDFESYSATGVGYDNSHTMDTATGLRARFYSTYYGSGSDPLNGSNWSVMGSSDYLTLNTSNGVGGSKCALFKVNAGNFFHYVQSKHYFGVPTAIGKGYKLSVMLHSGYSDTGMATPTGYDTKVTLIAYYNKALNTSGSNSAATATYTVPHHTGWGEYTVDLDSSKTVYAFGIHLAKASGTIYLPMDNVKLYTSFPYETNWPKGTFKTNVSVLGNSIPVLFSFSDQLKRAVIKLANTNDAGITSYSYNQSDSTFTINTNGSYLGQTYGTITGKYDKANNRLTNINISGGISSYLSNNGSITVPAATKYWNCDGSTSELQSVFKRRYGGTVDTTNADKIVSAPYLRVSGKNSLKFRLWDGGLAQLNLLNDINVTVSNIGFWVYSTASEDKDIRLFYYKGSNLTDYAEIGSVTAHSNQWTYCCMGFGAKPTIKNFQLAFDKWPSSAMVFIDDISLYTS